MFEIGYVSIRVGLELRLGLN